MSCSLIFRWPCGQPQPSPFDWQHALEQVNPKKVYLFAVDPKMDDPKVFLVRLAGLVKVYITNPKR